jgi:hypothetical protein
MIIKKIRKKEMFTITKINYNAMVQLITEDFKGFYQIKIISELYKKLDTKKQTVLKSDKTKDGNGNVILRKQELGYIKEGVLNIAIAKNEGVEIINADEIGERKKIELSEQDIKLLEAVFNIQKMRDEIDKELDKLQLERVEKCNEILEIFNDKNNEKEAIF